MVDRDEHGRPEPPTAADETATLLGFLDWQRATFAWKWSGLDSAGLATKVAASSMTLGGMIKHMAIVEDSWFSKWLFGNTAWTPWGDVDWSADPDWEWHSAADDTPDQLRTLWQEAVDRSRTNVAEALAADPDLGQMAKRTDSYGWTASLRWIICHMIEEYARHNGHADLIREDVDGQTGE
ncbi:MAG TPA: DinB family protein [Pseudonocardiaceae bacterium]|jgi:uncharacterized damage-inducible protein DinB